MFHIFVAGHRGREIALKALLVDRVAFLAEKAAARFLCPGEDILRIARRFNAGNHRASHTSPEGTADEWGVGLELKRPFGTRHLFGVKTQR